MDEAQKSRLRTYAWNYFAYHADQRMKTFQFYLILVTAFAAGIVALLTKTTTVSSGVVDSTRLSSYLCFIIALLSLMFGLLDRRNAKLVKNGESALSYLDTLEGHLEDSAPHVLALFIADDHATKVKPTGWYISYTDILTGIFGVFGVLAFILGIILW